MGGEKGSEDRKEVNWVVVVRSTIVRLRYVHRVHEKEVEKPQAKQGWLNQLQGLYCLYRVLYCTVVSKTKTVREREAASG